MHVESRSGRSYSDSFVRHAEMQRESIARIPALSIYQESVTVLVDRSYLNE